MDYQMMKLRAENRLIPAQVAVEDGRIYFKFRFNRKLMDEIKNMSGAKWHGFDNNPRKIWSAPLTPRNVFQLKYLKNENPYAPYDADLLNCVTDRPLFKHQVEAVRHILTRHYCMFAGEMGVGKSLAAIEVMEQSGLKDWWYIAPKSALKSVELELLKWESRVKPRLLTYDKFRIDLESWDGVAPQGVVFDESARIKNSTSQRSQAASHLANSVRLEHKEKGFVICLTGTPAPKAPTDWFWQCFSDDTWITTDQGLKQIKELIHQKTNILVDNHKVKTNGFFKTGTKQLYKINTNEGYSVRATEDQKFLVNYDGLKLWRKLCELEIGDEIKISTPESYNHWEGTGSENEGYILGLLFGDGNVTKKESGYYSRLQFFEGDFCLIPEVCKILEQDNITSSGEALIIHGGRINDIVREWGITPKKIIDHNIMTASSSFIIGFLRGMFDADGSVSKDTLRITLAQVDKDRIYKIQLLLQSLGIYCKIRIKKNVGISYIDGRKINTSDFCYEIQIINTEAIKFQYIIDFNQTKKKERLIKRIKNRHNWTSTPVATVESVEQDSIEDVYDIEVPGIHKFSANGFIAHNCEVAMPGFLREGTEAKFRNRLCLTEMCEAQYGGSYPKLITWWDDDNKCKICGQFKDAINHNLTEPGYHEFTRSINEVSKLSKRLKGLVLVQFKKDCFDLPDKQYRIIEVKPTQSILNVARTLANTASSTIKALTLLRELSDGFQYTKVKTGTETCSLCLGNKTIQHPKPDTDPLEYEEIPCPNCGSTGIQSIYERDSTFIDCPKNDVVLNLLDEHMEVARLVFYAGFTASIDHLCKMVKEAGWIVIRIDGQGWTVSDKEGNSYDLNEALQAMDLSHPKYNEFRNAFPLLCVIGHPASGSEGLTFTASPSIVYYSNDFNGMYRLQSEDRIHRPGMDNNRGATIIDLFHLPTDKYVLDNLKQKKQLQSLSLGNIIKVLDEKSND